MNHVTLIGRLGQEPDLKKTQSGISVVTLGLCTSKKVKHKESGNWQDIPTWHKVVVWDKLADVCAQFLYKGAQVAVIGEIETQKWKDKDGKEIQQQVIRGNEIEFLSPKREQPKPESNYEEDIPF